MHKIFSFTLNLKNDLIFTTVLRMANVYGIYVKNMKKNKGTTNDEDIIFEEKLFAISNSREISDL